MHPNHRAQTTAAHVTYIVVFGWGTASNTFSGLASGSASGFGGGAAGAVFGGAMGVDEAAGWGLVTGASGISRKRTRMAQRGGVAYLPSRRPEVSSDH